MMMQKSGTANMRHPQELILIKKSSRREHPIYQLSILDYQKKKLDAFLDLNSRYLDIPKASLNLKCPLTHDDLWWKNIRVCHACYLLPTLGLKNPKLGFKTHCTYIDNMYPNFFFK